MVSLKELKIICKENENDTNILNQLYNKRKEKEKRKGDNKKFINNNLISKLVLIDTDISGRHFCFRMLMFCCLL